ELVAAVEFQRSRRIHSKVAGAHTAEGDVKGAVIEDLHVAARVQDERQPAVAAAGLAQGAAGRVPEGRLAAVAGPDKPGIRLDVEYPAVGIVDNRAVGSPEGTVAEHASAIVERQQATVEQLTIGGNVQ